MRLSSEVEHLSLPQPHQRLTNQSCPRFNFHSRGVLGRDVQQLRFGIGPISRDITTPLQKISHTPFREGGSSRSPRPFLVLGECSSTCISRVATERGGQ